MSQSRAPKEKTRTGPTPYLVPGRDGASETHEQVGHGHETNPYHHGEKAEQPLKHRLDADEDEDREENRQGGGDCDQKGQMVFNFLRGDKVTKAHFRNTTVAVIYVIKVPSTFITVKTHWVLKVISEAEQCELTTT